MPNWALECQLIAFINPSIHGAHVVLAKLSLYFCSNMPPTVTLMGVSAFCRDGRPHKATLPTVLISYGTPWVSILVLVQNWVSILDVASGML